ncbi:MAG: class I SAM-dependent methyltransferase [Planctomycetota bacterium]
MTVLDTAWFETSNGERLRLDPVHRDRVKPANSGYGKEGSVDLVPYLVRVEERVRLGAHLLELHGRSVEGARVLVVGAEDGAEALALLARGAATVTGTDHGDAFVDDARRRERDEVRQRVVAVAKEAAAALSWDSDHLARVHEGVRYEIDDLCDSSLPDGAFDLIVSWQTLEHIPDVPAAMRETSRLLAPGGLAYHEYNPFFAIDGGHTPVTLDFAWGHARLDRADIARFLREHRSEEADEAMSFLDSALNGASQRDVRSAIEAAGLETCAWIPRFRPEDALGVTPEILGAVQRLYPSVQLIDLTSRIVRCVLRRPAG